jgi:hypothetical protein
MAGIVGALREVTPSAPSGAYDDTYDGVVHDHMPAQLGLFFLTGAALTLWITRKDGKPTRRLLTIFVALLHVAVGARLAIAFGAIPLLLGKGPNSPGDFAVINPFLALVSQASFLALGGILVCCTLTLRQMRKL